MSARDALTTVMDTVHQYTDFAMREESNSFQFSMIVVAFELLDLLDGS
jgi:hypothetical protein